MGRGPGRSGVERFEIYLVDLEPTVGHEMRKTRPCLVLSPNEINRSGRPVIVAPLTTAVRRYTSRVPSDFEGRPGYIALDQLRAVDQSRLVRRLGRLDADIGLQCLVTLQEMFAP